MNETMIARKLMQNEFICPYNDEPAYQWLKHPENFERMSQILAPLGVKLAVFADGDVFAGVNVALTEADKRKVVKAFESIHYDIQPLVDILTALASADADGDTLYMGKVLKQDQLVITVNSNEEFASRLKKASDYTNSANKPNDEQVEALLNKLHKEGLIHLVNPAQKIYRVTGKMEYVNRIIEFINENYLEKEAEPDNQQGLEL